MKNKHNILRKTIDNFYINLGLAAKILNVTPASMHTMRSHKYKWSKKTQDARITQLMLGYSTWLDNHVLKVDAFVDAIIKKEEEDLKNVQQRYVSRKDKTFTNDNGINP